MSSKTTLNHATKNLTNATFAKLIHRKWTPGAKVIGKIIADSLPPPNQSFHAKAKNHISLTLFEPTDLDNSTNASMAKIFAKS